jgi:Tfp pilus assembly protein PilN
MALLAAAAGVAALVAPGYRDQARRAALKAQIARHDAEVKAVERVQGELERRRKLLATVEALEPAAMKPLPVLRELTELMPTDAWLTLLSLDGKGVELTGQAAAASSLIPLLENSPRLERVEFASPVTRGRDREQFRILARWEGAGASALVMPPATPAVAAPSAPGTVAPGAPGAAAPGPAAPRPGAPAPAARASQPAAPPAARPAPEDDLDPAAQRRPGAVPVEPRRAVPPPEPRR